MGVLVCSPVMQTGQSQVEGWWHACMPLIHILSLNFWILYSLLLQVKGARKFFFFFTFLFSFYNKHKQELNSTVLPLKNICMAIHGFTQTQLLVTDCIFYFCQRHVKEVPWLLLICWLYRFKGNWWVQNQCCLYSWKHTKRSVYSLCDQGQKIKLSHHINQFLPHVAVSKGICTSICFIWRQDEKPAYVASPELHFNLLALSILVTISFQYNETAPLYTWLIGV